LSGLAVPLVLQRACLVSNAPLPGLMIGIHLPPFQQIRLHRCQSTFSTIPASD
jgi:hypothetical protein